MSRRSAISIGFALVMSIQGTAARADHAPAPTSVSAPAVVCSASGSVVVHGTTEPAPSSITVYDNASALSYQFPDPGSSWSATLTNVEPGVHELYATSTIDGHESAPSNTVTTEVIDPADAISSFSTSLTRFSPANRDGYKDTVNIQGVVERAGEIRFEVRRAGDLVSATAWARTAAGDERSFIWDGKGSNSYNGGTFVTSGTYEVVVLYREESGSECSAQSSVGVVVDNFAPLPTSYNTNFKVFHPREDDAYIEYRDDITFRYRNAENAFGKVQLFRSGETSPFRTLKVGAWGTSGSATWNGRTSSGRLYPAETYYWRWVLMDGVKNVRRLPKQSFYLSHKRLVGKSKLISKYGDSFSGYYEEECGEVTSYNSAYVRGVLLDVPDCVYDDSQSSDHAVVAYSFSLPNARYYHSARLLIYGHSNLFSRAYCAIRNDGGSFTPAGYVERQSSGWDSCAGKSLRGRTAGGRSRWAVLVLSECDCWDEDYDIGVVSLKVKYAVLS